MTNFEKSKENLSGPVAIVAVGAEVARSDIANLFQFAAILNINLAVINILPLPVWFLPVPATYLCVTLDRYSVLILDAMSWDMRRSFTCTLSEAMCVLHAQSAALQTGR